MTEERILEETPVVDVVEDEGAKWEEVTDEDMHDALENEIEVDDIEPLAPLSLREARVYARRLSEFVTINMDYIKRAGSSTMRDYTHDLDALVQTLACIWETSRARKRNLLSRLAHDSSGAIDE
jgi:hypothetical protein